MHRYLSIVLFIFMISCKQKEIAYNPVIKKRIEYENSKQIKRYAIDTTFLATYKNEQLTSFYKINHFQTVWNIPENRKLIAKILSKADEEGLDSKEYYTEDFEKFERNANFLLEKELVDYDILLTISLQKYISHLTNGKLNPQELYSDWDLKPNEIDINQTLTDAINGDSLKVVIEKAKPNHIVYKKLKNALAILNQFPIDTLKNIEIADKLKPNDTNNSLIDIKKRLIYWKDLKSIDSLTPIYDEETLKAVKKFQLRHGLAADGVIGKATIAALNVSKNTRKQQIIANMERWKWFPKDMGEHYIIINIPEYKLHTVFKNDTTRTHNIIVGTSKRKTPILNSKLSYAVFNPTWTVPPTILKEDIIPATTKNRNYLAGKNITIYDKNGKEVSPWVWDPEKALNYRYVQSPGTYNSLGMVKIIFPNNFTVYLHDTNHKEYFDKTDRSLSSGCVRVQNPLELTEYLLDDKANWSLEKITETLKKEKTQNAKIKNEIYIHQLYWTAWSDKNTLQFRPDIYNLDGDLYSKLRN